MGTVFTKIIKHILLKIKNAVYLAIYQPSALTNKQTEFLKLVNLCFYVVLTFLDMIVSFQFWTFDKIFFYPLFQIFVGLHLRVESWKEMGA